MDEKITRQLCEFGERHEEILGVFLFGSHAHGRAHPGSDIDVALYTEPDGNPASRPLEAQLQYTVELEQMLKNRVDVVILNQAPPILRHQILRKGKLIFERDRHRFRRFIGEALVEFYDEIVTLQPAQNALIRRHLLGR